MYQHQHAFLVDKPNTLDRVAHHALKQVIAGQGSDMSRDADGQMGSPATASVRLNDRFYHAALCEDRDQIWRVVKDAQQAGMSDQTIKGSVVPTVARQLGTDWVNDIATFGAVTIGCARLQAVVRHLDVVPPTLSATESVTQTNCLVVVPKGNHHTLGAVVLSDQLRFAGAAVKLVLGVCDDAMTRLVAAQKFDAVMISASMGQNIDVLRGLVQHARCQRSDPKVVIGGGVLEDCNDLMRATGTDYVSQDMREVLDFCTRDCC